jgi:hypothetical protein
LAYAALVFVTRRREADLGASEVDGWGATSAESNVRFLVDMKIEDEHEMVKMNHRNTRRVTSHLSVLKNLFFITTDRFSIPLLPF